MASGTKITFHTPVGDLDENAQSKLDGLTAKDRRQTEVDLRASFHLPQFSGIRKAVVIKKLGVGRAGSPIPVGTCVLTDERSGMALIRDGWAREASRDEANAAIPSESFAPKTAYGKFADANDKIAVQRDIPELGVKAGEFISAYKLVEFIGSKAEKIRAKEGRKLKKVPSTPQGQKDAIKRAVAHTDLGKQLRRKGVVIGDKK